MAHKCLAARSAAFMLHVWYAIDFWFDYLLGYFPFFFFQNLGLASELMLAIGLALGLQFRVSVTVKDSVRVSIGLGLRLGLRLDLGFIFYVYFVSAKPVAATILVAK